MKKIELSGKKGKGIYFLIDDEDVSKLEGHSWYLSSGYVQTKVNSKNLYLHRHIMNTPLGMDTDHINHDLLDNRKCNLRICNRTQNNANRIKKTLLKGITHPYKHSWIAQISFNDKNICIGKFRSPIEAAKAYDKKAKELFGEFAVINNV